MTETAKQNLASRDIEDELVADLARLVWREQNLATLRISEQVQKLWDDAPANEEKIARAIIAATRRQ
jgi:hypothetical protein